MSRSSGGRGGDDSGIHGRIDGLGELSGEAELLLADARFLDVPPKGAKERNAHAIAAVIAAGGALGGATTAAAATATAATGTAATGTAVVATTTAATTTAASITATSTLATSTIATSTAAAVTATGTVGIASLWTVSAKVIGLVAIVSSGIAAGGYAVSSSAPEPSVESALPEPAFEKVSHGSVLGSAREPGGSTPEPRNSVPHGDAPLIDALLNDPVPSHPAPTQVTGEVVEASRSLRLNEDRRRNIAQARAASRVEPVEAPMDSTRETPVTDLSLADEVTLLRRAFARWESSPHEARRHLRAHEIRFPEGQLRSERQQLDVMIGCRLGESGARHRAESMTRQNEALRVRLSGICGLPRD